jgi:hypothetical protein
MKSKIVMFAIFSCFLFIRCDKEESNPIVSGSDIESDTKIDAIADDILQIVESQSNETSVAGRNKNSGSYLTNCATVNTVVDGNSRTRTVDFGTTNCTLANGNLVRGKIIVSFTNNFDALTRTISYSFDNFYHNDRRVDGTRTVVKTRLQNGNPQATININMTVTYPNGSVFTRIGERVREFTEGYTTTVLTDNVFSITGNWKTTLPSGTLHTTTITKPLIAKWGCPNIVSGTISIVRTGNPWILDYGNGDCDNKATLTINGETQNFILRN